MFVETNYPFLRPPDEPGKGAPWRKVELLWTRDFSKYAYFRYKGVIYSFKKWYVRSLKGKPLDMSNRCYMKAGFSDPDLFDPDEGSTVVHVS